MLPTIYICCKPFFIVGAHDCMYAKRTTRHAWMDHGWVVSCRVFPLSFDETMSAVHLGESKIRLDHLKS